MVPWYSKPMPAATISGVTPSSVGISGSAPRATSSRIAATSLAWAARQNVVAPTRLDPVVAVAELAEPQLAPHARVQVGALVDRAAPSTPDTTSSPRRRSAAGTRCCDATSCRARRRARSGRRCWPSDGSAPWSSRYAAMSRWPLMIASTMADVCSPPDHEVDVGAAARPARARRRRWPSRAAKCSAVIPPMTVAPNTRPCAADRWRPSGPTGAPPLPAAADRRWRRPARASAAPPWS